MSQLAVEFCDPRDREAEIKELFARSGKQSFDPVFERAYRRRAEGGLRSWIALSDDQAVMHISVSPIRFKGNGRSLTGGVLGDLMVDATHRDFWAPVRLLRKMVADLRRSGDVDFLLSTTVADAEAVFKAGGFRSFGELRRYVLPLSRPYLAFARLRARVGRRSATPGAMPITTGDAALPYATSLWRPEVDADFYGTRIPRAEFTDDNWLTVAGRDRSTAGSALLSRNQDLPEEMGVADLFWNETGVRLGELVHAAGSWARSQNFDKLTMTTLQESNVTRELQRVGFIGRDVRSKLLIQPLGASAPPPIADWFLPSFALSGW